MRLHPRPPITRAVGLCAALGAAAIGLPALAEPIYLNDRNITVSLGEGMPAEPFANRSTAASLASIIDAPSATASEFHLQSTHVWTRSALSLRFDLGAEYDLTTLHFWNYHSESFDVDNIDFVFFDGANQPVGSLLGVAPALGGSAPSDATLIFAENFALSFPSRVRFVNAVLTGSNNEVDFNNIGFTGQRSDASPVPAPATPWLALAGVAALWRRRARR